MVRVGFNTGVPNTGDLGVFLKTAGKIKSSGVLTLNAKLKRLHATEEEVSGMGVNNTTHNVVEIAHRVDEFLFTGEGTSENIIMTSEIFSARMKDKIGPEGNCLLVDRSGKSTVDAHGSTMGMTKFGSTFDIDATEVRIGGGLSKKKGNLVLLKSLFETLEIVRLDNSHTNIHLRKKVKHKLTSPPVAVGSGDDVAIGRNECEKHGGNGIHSRRRNDTVFSTLECFNLLLASPASGVTIPSVLIRIKSFLLVGNQFLSILEKISRSLDNWSGKSVGNLGSANPLTRVNRRSR
mmetsp:Transcript_34889/g.62740  ORF Transcript_34889/g.62740 Transcript_34889/m.62740 type:complete len:292 (+) Transcript_34889:817-1692(+)